MGVDDHSALRECSSVDETKKQCELVLHSSGAVILLTLEKPRAH